METFISNLDLNKAHRDDMISTRMLKIYSKSIIKPLKILSKQSLEKGCFTVEWKKVNIVSAYKKNEPQTRKNFCVRSLTTMCSKAMRRSPYKNVTVFHVK